MCSRPRTELGYSSSWWSPCCRSSWRNARHLPHGRSRAGDRHLNFYETRDNLDTKAVECPVGGAQRAGQPEPFMQQRVQPLAGRLAREVAHVGACAERIALTRRDDNPHRVICAGVRQQPQILAEQCTRQPVQRCGAIEPADEHRTVPFGYDVAHGESSAAQRSGSLPALIVDCSSTYSESPSEPNSRPMPDCLNPPNGAVVSSVYMLMPKVPVRTCSAMLKPLATSVAPTEPP